MTGSLGIFVFHSCTCSQGGFCLWIFAAVSCSSLVLPAYLSNLGGSGLPYDRMSLLDPRRVLAFLLCSNFRLQLGWCEDFQTSYMLHWKLEVQFMSVQSPLSSQQSYQGGSFYCHFEETKTLRCSVTCPMLSQLKVAKPGFEHREPEPPAFTPSHCLTGASARVQRSGVGVQLSSLCCCDLGQALKRLVCWAM